jgi:nucleotide-binding universal stress UspA family protein
MPNRSSDEAASASEVEEERIHGELEGALLLAEASDFGATPGVLVETEMRPGHPAQEIIKAAEQHQVDLIVPGHNGRSGSRRAVPWTIGSAGPRRTSGTRG